MVSIFVDSADPDVCEHWLSMAFVQGVTTNSTLVRKAGISSLSRLARQILDLGAKELHLQVLSEESAEALKQAQELAAISPRVRVKIPVVTSAGVSRLPLVRQCLDRGIPVNVTACTTFGQSVASVGTDARYVSSLWCRTRDAGEDPGKMVERLARVRDAGPSSTGILVGSIREPQDASDAVLAGPDVVTVPPVVLGRWLESEQSVELARQFHNDSQGITS